MTGRELAALRVARRAEWEVRVRAALGGGRAAAARALGVSTRTVGRWAKELGLGAPRGGQREGAGRKPTVRSDKKDSGTVNQSDSRGV